MHPVSAQQRLFGEKSYSSYSIELSDVYEQIMWSVSSSGAFGVEQSSKAVPG